MDDPEPKPNLPKPNLPLLRAVLAQIDAAPERWRQDAWATKKDCGTAYCVAGWAVHLSHPEATPEWTHLDEAFLVRGSQGEIWIGDEAQRLLGLTDVERLRLFYGRNTRSLVQRYAEQIAARAGESL